MADRTSHDFRFGAPTTNAANNVFGVTLSTPAQSSITIYNTSGVSNFVRPFGIPMSNGVVGAAAFGSPSSMTMMSFDGFSGNHGIPIPPTGPLLSAASEGRLADVQRIIREGVSAADLNEIGGPMQRTPLMAAVNNKHWECALELLAADGLEVNKGVPEGVSHIAAVVQGATMMSLNNVNNNTPSSTAEANAMAFRIIEVLNTQFNLPLDPIDVEDGNKTPFHYAAKSKLDGAVAFVDWFLEKGVDVNTGLMLSASPNARGQRVPPSPISLATNNNVIDALLRAGAAVEATSVISVCMQSNHGPELSKAVRTLLDAGADLDDSLCREQPKEWWSQKESAIEVLVDNMVSCEAFTYDDGDEEDYFDASDDYF